MDSQGGANGQSTTEPNVNVSAVAEQLQTRMKTIGKSIPELDRQRNQMELDLLKDILIFNQGVTRQIGQLEKSVKDEINGLQVEQEKEE